jgi:flagellar protein FlaF
MYATQLQAYKKTHEVTMSGREVEASVLNKAASKLRECQEKWDFLGHNTRFEEAIKFNQLIWSIFQSELARDDNPLPKQLRQDILSLSAFIDKRIFEIMAYPDPEKLTAIIRINENLADGLMNMPSANGQ